MSDRGQLGTPEWRTTFEKRLRRQARIARLGHWRSVSAGEPRFSDGNQGFYVRDGRLQLAWMIAAIERARRRVDLEMYIFEPDTAGKALLAALVAAAERGVVVRLLFDSVGCNNAGAGFFAPIAEAGGHVVEFNPVAPWRLRVSRLGKMQHWTPNERDHRKLLICDAPLSWATEDRELDAEPRPPAEDSSGESAIAITGGRNIGDHYVTKPLGDGQWRDCGVVLFGPVAVDLGKLFDAMWFHADGPEVAVPKLGSPKVGELAVLPLGSQPGFMNLLQWAISRLASSVHEELRISCAYFLPSKRWLKALAHVAARTGRCAILIPRESDVPQVDAATRHLLGGLLRAGASVYRYGTAILHEKTILYDRRVTIIGSSNLDPRSFKLNYELSVLILGATFAAPIVAWHEKDLADAQRYTLDEWQARSRWDRMVDWFWSLLKSQL